MSAAALTLIAWSAFGQAYRAQAGGPPPAELAEALRRALVPEGVRVVESRGFPFCELWLRNAPLESGPVEDALRRDALPEGTLLGVIQYYAPSADRAGRGFPRGLYTLRSAGGDSLALIPSAADQDLAPPEDAARLRKGLLRFGMASEGPAPRFQMSARGEWFLHARLGDVLIALLVAGVASR